MTEIEAIERLQTLNIILTNKAGHKEDGIEKIFTFSDITAICKAIQALEEIQRQKTKIGMFVTLEERMEISSKFAKLEQYESIGTVEEIQFMKTACDMNDDLLNSLANSVREKMKYEALGTMEEFKALKEKSVAKKAEYRKMVYPRHKWMEEDGKIDEFAYSSGYCNGPICERCYYSFCEHCNPDGWEEECIVEDYICPSCGEKVNRKNTHCKCGQKLDWD